MSKTDTVAPFSLIFVRKVHFSENRSARENFCKKWPTPLFVEDQDAAQQARGVLGRGVHWPAPNSRMVCTRMVCSRALGRSALSQPCLRAPASALEAKLRQWRSAQSVLGWGGVRTAQRT